MYEVVYCADCKKPIKSVPSWLAGVNVRFTCETCRQKHPRGVVGFDAVPAPRLAGDPELEVDGIIDEPPGELVEEDEVLEDAGDDAIVAGLPEE